jgi:hypothetical protein
MERKHVYSIRRPLRIIDDLSTDKPKLFIVVSVIVVSALAVPLIIHYMSHPQHIYHIVLHIVSLILSIFLCIVSLSSYFRNGGSRLLFMSLGFLSLVVVEILLLFYAARGIQDIVIPLVNIELPHLILFAMLALFGLGVVKVDSR